MKIAGLALLVSGWFLVVSALCLLATAGMRDGFVLAGVGVEMVGLVLAMRAHRAPAGGHE